MGSVQEALVRLGVVELEELKTARDGAADVAEAGAATVSIPALHLLPVRALTLVAGP